MPRITSFSGKSIAGKTLNKRPVSRFSEAAKVFINSFSGDKKYIDITNGSDSNNGDTDATPYQTLGYAQAQTASIGTAVMYVIKPGVYNLTPVTVGHRYHNLLLLGSAMAIYPELSFVQLDRWYFSGRLPLINVMPLW